MLGLYAFFYGTLHLLTYVWFDRFFNLRSIAGDVLQRPFIAIGMTAFFLMLPLAITSTNGMIKRLGGKRWAKLHRLVYLAGVAGVIHFWMLVSLTPDYLDVRVILFCYLLSFANQVCSSHHPQTRSRSSGE